MRGRGWDDSSTTKAPSNKQSSQPSSRRHRPCSKSIKLSCSHWQLWALFARPFFLFFPPPHRPLPSWIPPPSLDLKTPPFPRGNAIFYRGWGAARGLEGVTPQKKEGISLKNGAQKLVRVTQRPENTAIWKRRTFLHHAVFMLFIFYLICNVRRPPDYSSNLCPPEIWSIWFFQGVFLGLLYKKKKGSRPKTPPQKVI